MELSTKPKHEGHASPEIAAQRYVPQSVKMCGTCKLRPADFNGVCAICDEGSER